MTTPDDSAASARTTDEALRHAISRHRLGELDVAEKIYAGLAADGRARLKRRPG